ncbi:hypothetical protein QYE76_066948 [Lolium multiflorum]|uniref:Uncharacterized protein n=1 Tax=Lolium multiflorum TaxID=4521 RepID=A0AAD8WAH1_LOLMU|nr:hypothetical protein QYE76_066948 [Lolium multiflorum]
MIPPTMEPNISRGDKNEDEYEEDDWVVSLRDKGKSVFKVLCKDQIASSHFFEILTTAIESQKLIWMHENTIDKMGALEREYANDVASLKNDLEEEQDTVASLEEQLETLEVSQNEIFSKLTKERDHAKAQLKLLKNENSKVGVGHDKLVKDLDDLDKAHKALESEHSILTKSHEQLQASYLKEHAINPSKEIFSELDEINAQYLIFTGTFQSTEEGPEGCQGGPTPQGSAAKGGRAPLWSGGTRASRLPFRYLRLFKCAGSMEKPPFKPLPPKEGNEEKKKKKGTKKKKKGNKKKEVTAYPRVYEVTIGNRKYVAPNNYYDNESEYDDLSMPFTHISDHDLDEHTTFDIGNLFGTDYESNDDSIIHVPSNDDIESSKLGDVVLEDPIFETSTFSENDDITYSGLDNRYKNGYDIGAVRGGGDEGAQILESLCLLRAEEIQFIEAEEAEQRKAI